MTYGACLPAANQYYDNISLMNTQATQVKPADGSSSKNYLFIAGGYGYSQSMGGMTTYPTVSGQRDLCAIGKL